MKKSFSLYCAPCGKNVDAVRVNGDIVYPSRTDLKYKLFYQCPNCKNFVGTHQRSGIPLGSICSKEVKQARMAIHNILDPLWKNGKAPRAVVYAKMSKIIGKTFHTAEINTPEEARIALKAANSVSIDILF